MARVRAGGERGPGLGAQLHSAASFTVRAVRRRDTSQTHLTVTPRTADTRGHRGRFLGPVLSRYTV